MADSLGRTADAVAFLERLAEQPYRFDFYETMRRLECLAADQPRWGEARRPAEEAVRFGQDPDLSFAPAPLASFTPGSAGVPARLQVRLFGLLGPNGPLPLYMTEYVRERLRHQPSDRTLSRFLDLLQHRLLTFFYRAWAQAQPHINRDRPDDDHFAAYIGAFFGIQPAPLRDRDRVPDEAKLFHAGRLVRQVRNAEGLSTILRQFFRVPVVVEEFVGNWLTLREQEQSRLVGESACLGAGAVLGSRVWDRQHKIRLRIGPLTLDQYESFLPGGSLLPKLVDWLRLYLTYELDWDVSLVLTQAHVPRLLLGYAGGPRVAPEAVTMPRLGWTTWLGQRREQNDADNLCLDAEAQVRRGAMAA